jgi:peptide/nickel transport system ATP-binding protein
MACQPKLLICDEPTTALDVTVQAQILELMHELKTKHNMSMILITHDFGVVAEVCDRVLVMYAGKIVEEAPVEELFERPCHPYTQGLLELIPRLEIKKERLSSIPGSVPMPGSMPIGCSFADRCTKVMDRCRQEAPKKYEIDKSHFCSCWLYDGEEAKVDGAS